VGEKCLPEGHSALNWRLGPMSCCSTLTSRPSASASVTLCYHLVLVLPTIVVCYRWR
jgi:hypothetical protein